MIELDLIRELGERGFLCPKGHRIGSQPVAACSKCADVAELIRDAIAEAIAEREDPD